MADGTPIIIKKKKGHEHGHHGGAWKVAYADFVTAMMAFFMVMWIMGMSESTKSMIQGYFNDPIGFTKNEPKSRVNIQPSGGSQYNPASADKKGMGASDVSGEKSSAAATGDEIKKEIKQAASGDPNLKSLYANVDVNVSEEGLEIDFVENSGAVFFEIGSAQIRSGAMQLISRIAPILAKTKRKIVVEGHTDARPYNGNGYDNWDLSNDRAFAMRRALRGTGVPSNQFLEVRAYGPTRLKNTSDPYHFSNRRVTVLLPFTWRGGDRTSNLPQDILREKVQGVFKTPVNIKPSPTVIRKDE